MTAALSPAEQAEVARFGLFEEEILREISEHIDDVIGCLRDGCETPAAWRITTRCCGRGAFLCSGHLADSREHCARAFSFSGVAECADCHAVRPTPCTYEDIFRVVPL